MAREADLDVPAAGARRSTGRSFFLLVYGTDLVLLLLIGRVPLAYNFRYLWVRRRDTALTALAFTVVVALVVVLLAFVNGMYKLNESTGIPGNVMVLSDGVDRRTVQQSRLRRREQRRTRNSRDRRRGRPTAEEAVSGGPRRDRPGRQAHGNCPPILRRRRNRRARCGSRVSSRTS